ncbi:MAG: helix-turn-helix transcriptional regulator [Peptococcaceae bacterium]|nr:helix-turn-helix transcriptional regulator [Peptococcaceae bacterium]
MNSKKILSENLKKYRQANRISQEELAARAELSTRGYGKIERGEVHPSLETLDKLARATGLSQSFLLSEESNTEPAVS